jgi:hypothetical protein
LPQDHVLQQVDADELGGRRSVFGDANVVVAGGGIARWMETATM